MANDYKSFYLKDIIPIIDRCAMQCFVSPQKTLVGNQVSTVESLSILNDRIAQHNEGIRAMADHLIDLLAVEADDE